MHVMMLGWEFPPHISGGLGTACYGIAKALRDDGDVQLTLTLPALYGGEDGSLARLVDLSAAGDAALPPCPVKESAYGSGLFERTSVYAAQVLALQEELGQFDVIHAHDWLTVPAALALQTSSRRPLVLHIHATEYDRAGEHGDPGIAAIERAGMDAAQQIIVVSNATRKIIIERYHQTPGKVLTVYNGIESSRSSLRDRSRSQPILVSFMGRVTRQKGPAYYIEAAGLALARRPDLCFVLAGDGDLLPAVQELAVCRGIAERIYFPGFLPADEVRHLLEHSDIYVMPSVSEPFGIAALEAIDAGAAVILACQSGAAEVLEHVIKVEYWDCSAMADAIVLLAEDAVLREQFRRQAKAELAAINWAAAATRLKAVYQGLTRKIMSSPRITPADAA